jgi:hypothetical protein
LARAGGGLKKAARRPFGIWRQECEINIARPASSAAAKVPMKAACTNGTDLRKALRIDCSRSADC